MKKRLVFSVSTRHVGVAALLMWLATPGFANDGRNRYEQGVPAQLFHWHEPAGAGSGYRVLAEDQAGGADGDPAYRWVTRPALALVRLASRRTHEVLGAAPLPYPVFDLASENGDTPLKMEAEGARGRHPGNSHDGGWNLDLGYYLSSEKGQVETPDYAACTEHHKVGAEGKLLEARQCTGPADRLDTPRQTFFLLELLRMDRAQFGGEWVEAIGIDAEVRAAVLVQARQWAAQRRHGVTPALVEALGAVFASSPYEGWATSHHHHIHLRLRALDTSGRYRDAFKRLIDADQALEARLLAGSAAAARGCALITELSSFNLARSLDLRVTGCTQPAELMGLRFRFQGGAWSPPLDPLDPLHHVIPAPTRAQFSTAPAEVELAFADGQRALLRREVALPAQAPWLRVRVEARDFVARTRALPEGLDVTLDHPPAHAALITSLDLLVWRQGATAPERVSLSPASPRATVTAPETVESMEAEVGLSKRVRLRVPVPRSAPAS
ncbi:hypothetical protein [Inhella gelatinilytica]|uniref:Uncharacterized protein n=1 Tax=Inhella gelatinilytica TaxID=2795030 RepID=A0A931IWU4_9BURK|nr:hypothetical protein [Inhella gelatinilytica]MBH9551498.1 hypothetical protein [Inhella gelatinilytica]